VEQNETNPEIETEDTGTGEHPVTLNMDELSTEAVLFIQQLTTERDEAEQARMRALADFKNFQRRSIENEQRSRKNGISSIVRGLFPALDNLDLALQNASRATSMEQVIEGITMLKAELERGLETSGIEIISPEANEEFNPERHEAVAQQPFDGVAEGSVAETVQAGYALQEMVLRPAKVVLASA
jgi:molecular chaperone GrpE